MKPYTGQAGFCKLRVCVLPRSDFCGGSCDMLVFTGEACAKGPSMETCLVGRNGREYAWKACGIYYGEVIPPLFVWSAPGLKSVELFLGED